MSENNPETIRIALTKEGLNMIVKGSPVLNQKKYPERVQMITEELRSTDDLRPYLRILYPKRQRFHVTDHELLPTPPSSRRAIGYAPSSPLIHSTSNLPPMEDHTPKSLRPIGFKTEENPIIEAEVTRIQILTLLKVHLPKSSDQEIAMFADMISSRNAALESFLRKPRNEIETSKKIGY